MANNIKIISGNIFNTKAQTIVNTVNCVGVMGKGIALVFKLRYPNMFDVYQDYCRQNLISIGKLWIYKGNEKDPWVLNFPTKTHWKLPSEYEYIEKGLQKFVETYKDKGITSIAFPLLGANNGGLDGHKVEEIMISYLSKCDIPVEIYHYNPQAPDDLFEEFRRKWKQISQEQKKKMLRTSKRVETIDYAVNSENVRSMISLIEYPGIGIKTMECCFNLVMRSDNASLQFTDNI
jgi:O-acetyl-ADP-ribose deacetylase (regulator of RNase III)